MKSIEIKEGRFTLNVRLKTVAVGVLIVTAPLLMAPSCGADSSKGVGDAPVNQSKIDKLPAAVINFSDKYPNIEFKCNGSNGVYTNTRSGGYFVVIPNDVNCPKG
jgi:hypothetical protein